MGSEERFEYWRRNIGLVAAPVVFVAFLALPVAGLSVEAHRLLAVLGAVVVLWMTEAIPLAVTALLGPALCVLLGIGSAKEIFHGFADPIIFLFLGSFLIAEAMLGSAGSTPNIHRKPVTVRTGFRGDALDCSEPDILDRFFGKPRPNVRVLR